jgi:YVTN family beta-propeller protein
MRFIKKRRKSWGLMLLVVTLVTLAWVAVPLAKSATITVTSAADSGPGTLREALTTAISGDTITFDPSVFPPDTPATIALASPLPDITQGNLTIDGTGAGVIIDGSGTPENTVGISITSNGNTIKGLQILNFPGDGVAISGGAKDNTIGGDTTGECNVISGNALNGVSIAGEGSDNNTISGNYIGTDISGAVAIGNAWGGVWIGEGAQYNLIGGDMTGERNVISGSGRYGIRICDEGTDGNVVIGNHIGTDASGTVAIGNAETGVGIDDGAQYNLIGGDTPGERNVISGNDNGVYISGSGTVGNTVSGNYIGTDVSGISPLANEGNGVSISDGAQNNTIGGDTPGERNVISGNASNGIRIFGEGTDNNTVSGNYIGVDASGTAALPNSANGMDIGAPNNTIGGLTPGARNVVSGNGANGVMLAGSDSHNNTVVVNYIGTDASGTVALPNTYNGVAIQNGAANNDIGGVADGAGNVIAHNDGGGIMVDGSDSTGNTISHNSITANGGLGIDNVNGGNTELVPPVITKALTMTVSGTACPGCTIEIFSDDEDEGRFFEGSTTVESDGTFTLSCTEPFTGPNVTATATDAAGNTSEFSSHVPGSVPVIPQTFDLIATPGDEPVDIVISPNGSRAYVPGRNTDNLFVIDMATNQIIEVIDLYPEAAHPLGPAPEQLAITPDGSRLLVTNCNDDSLTVIDIATNTTIKTLRVGRQPADVAISPDGSLAYVANKWEQTMSVVDLIATEVLTTVNMSGGGGPFAVTFAPDGDRAYVAIQDAPVYIVDPARHSVIGSIEVPDSGWTGDLVISTDGKTGYLNALEDDMVIVLDLVNGQVTDTYTVTMPIGLALNADGSRLYVGTFGWAGESEYNLWMFDTQSGELVAGVTFVVNPPYDRCGADNEGLALTPDGSMLYVASVDADGVYIVDAETLDPIGFIPIQAQEPFGPYKGAISPDGTYLYVASALRQPATVSVIDTRNFQVVGEIVSHIGGSCVGHCLGLDISPDGNTLYLATTGGCVLVVDTETQAIADEFLAIYEGLQHIAVHPDGDRAYALDWAGRVYVIDLETLNVLTTLQAKAGGFVLKISPDGRRGYVGGESGFSVLDLTTDTVLKTVDFGVVGSFAAICPVGIKPDSSQYVVSQVFFMHVYDAASDEEVRNVDLGEWNPYRPLINDIVFSPDGSTGYVALGDEKAVFAFDADLWEVTAKIDIGRAPYFGMVPMWLVLSPDGGTLYALNSDSDNVVVIDTATNTVIKAIRVRRPYRIHLPLVTKNYQ